MPALRPLLTVACLFAIPAIAADSFEVATIKRTPDDWTGGRYFRMQTTNQFVAHGYQLRVLIAAAYNLNPKAVSGGPAWLDSERYDVLARTTEARPTLEQQMAMLRQLLTDRFHLTFHREKKEMSVYTLTVAKGGPKLKESVPVPGARPEDAPPLAFSLAPDVVRVPARNATTTELTYILQRAAFDRPVLDRTGLTARYDFDLEFAPDESLFGGILAATADRSKPGLFTAMQEQLGLKLEAGRGLVDAIVIDRIERPSEN